MRGKSIGYGATGCVGNDWRTGIGGCIGIGIGPSAVVLTSFVWMRRIVLRLAFLSTSLLIKHLIKMDGLIDQFLDFLGTSSDGDCLFHLEIESTIEHDTLSLIINTEGNRKTLESLSVRSRRSCLNEIVESVFTFQFIGTIAVNVGKCSHECLVILAKTVFFVGDDFTRP